MTRREHGTLYARPEGRAARNGEHDVANDYNRYNDKNSDKNQKKEEIKDAAKGAAQDAKGKALSLIHI